jgi:hypothetical protein
MQSNSDLDQIRERDRRRVDAPTHACPDRAAISADLDTLIAELRHARARVRELTDNDEDLRASAEIWCRLYEASAARANAAEAALQRDGRLLPANVRVLYEALDRVGDLTDALSGVIRECAACVREERAPDHLAELAAQVCERCAKALDALDVPAD